MSPVIHSEDNINVVIWPNEGEGKAKEPPHVHALIKGKGEVKIWLQSGEAVADKVKGKLNSREVNKATELVQRIYQKAKDKWDEIHG